MQKNKDIALLPRQQTEPTDWKKVDKVISVLKPILVATKCAESDTATVSEVIPLLKKLSHEINQVNGSGIGTLKKGGGGGGGGVATQKNK